ncbi:hypothetical protein HOC01_00270 [archaeon]|jgi:hypothetical protein|nr:hypothetical protein [archaeon]MBT6698726.1 hypothetical protein [archaeon]
MVVIRGSVAELVGSYDKFVSLDSTLDRAALLGDAICKYIEQDNFVRSVVEGDGSFMGRVIGYRDRILSLGRIDTFDRIKIDNGYDAGISGLVGDLNKVGVGVPLLNWDYTTKNQKDLQTKVRKIGVLGLVGTAGLVAVHPALAFLFGTALLWEPAYGFKKSNKQRVDWAYQSLGSNAFLADEFLKNLDLSQFRRSSG